MQNNTQYFIIADGQQKGPYPREVLVMQGMKPDTYVWREGMQGWAQASTLPELADLFVEESAFGGYAEAPVADQPPQPDNNGQAPYGQQQPPYGQQPPYRQQSPYGQPYGQQPPYGQPYGQQSPYRQPYNGMPAHTNWMPWAIVSTVINCFVGCIGLIFSIIGIVQANKANTFYRQGYEAEGDAANSSARTMTILGLVFAGLGILATIGLLSSGVLSVWENNPLL